MIELQELFTPVYGVNLEHNKMIESQEGIPFVSRTSQNNGVVGYVDKLEGIKPNPAMTISLAGSGSVMECFLQESEYYSGRDLYYLQPKVKLTKNQMLYYCMILRSNKYRYSFGRQANKTLHSIKIPSLDMIPSYVNKIKIEKPDQKPILIQKIKLNNSIQKTFYLDEIFILKRGERLTKEFREKGIVPFVTAGKTNLGVKQYIDSLNLKQEILQNKITIDMFCNSYYHFKEFSCDDNILTLKSKYNINKYAILFIVTIINRDKYRYQYGRQYRQKNFKQHKIKLPAKQNRKGEYEPDWQFMEDYIKSLPYSSNL